MEEINSAVKTSYVSLCSYGSQRVPSLSFHTVDFSLEQYKARLSGAEDTLYAKLPYFCSWIFMFCWLVAVNVVNPA